MSPAQRQERVLLSAERALHFAFAAFWLWLGLMLVTGLISVGLEVPAVRVTVGVILALNGVAFIAAGRLVHRGNPAIDVAAVVLVVLNLIATIADQLGPADIVALVAYAVLLGLLLFNLRVAGRSKRPDIPASGTGSHST